MAKIDRLGWEDGFSFKAYGVKLGLRVNDRRIVKDVAARLPFGSTPAPIKIVDHLYSLIGNPENADSRVRGLNLGYWNIQRIVRTRKFDDLLEAFESHVQLIVAEHAPKHVFVHAGVVGLNGRAIVIPGRSQSGKTTLVRELIRAGAVYYSDEFAVIDERGRVHPYPRPLGVRESNSFVSRKVPPEELGATIGVKPLPIGMVVATKYKESSRWRPRQLSRGKGVLEMMANTVSARQRPQLALSVLPLALASARIIKGSRGEAREVLDYLLSRSIDS